MKTWEEPTLFEMDHDDDDDPLTEQLALLIKAYGYANVLYELRRLAPSIIQASAPARWTDPETSHMAAKREYDVGRFSDRSQKARLLRVFSGDSWTDQQAAGRVVGFSSAPSAFEGCRRCSDLRAVNYIYDTGQRHVNQGSDAESVVWGITQEGIDALFRLDETGWSR